MAKRLLTLAILTVAVLCHCSAQANYTWSLHEQGDELVLTFNGTFAEGWHLSDQSLTLELADGVQPVGTFGNDRQRLRITKRPWRLRGFMQYIVCSDELCLAPQNVEFSAEGEAAAPGKQDEKPKETGSTATPDATPSGETAADSLLSAGIHTADTAATAAPSADTAIHHATTTEAAAAAASPLNVFLVAFLAGLLALLTPCVWPVIPLTVSYFLKNGRGLRDAAIFGCSIVGIFLLLGIAATLIFGAGTMNTLATNAVFNIVCFILLTIFGLSFIGLFQLTLPASWSTSLDAKATQKGGTLGILFMALTLVVVSFSCTAPIVGTLLVQAVAEQGSLLSPIVGMSGFSLALALPFTLFALFPKWLKRMPRSGKWMDIVKVTLGFIELAFALKFLSVADMAYGWHLLPWRTFLIIWAVLFAMLSAYLLYKWRTLRWFTIAALLPIALTAYLANGIMGGDTRLVAAFMPPKDDNATNVFHDYDKGMAEARRTGKRVFLDFTGYGCVNCRKMEAAVFTDAEVKRTLSNFIIIRLYVDDRTPLPRHVTTADGRILRTLGDKWSLLEQQRFGQLTQPLYAVTDANGNLLTPTTYSYDEDVERFLKWLETK